MLALLLISVVPRQYHQRVDNCGPTTSPGGNRARKPVTRANASRPAPLRQFEHVGSSSANKGWGWRSPGLPATSDRFDRHRHSDSRVPDIRLQANPATVSAAATVHQWRQVHAINWAAELTDSCFYTQLVRQSAPVTGAVTGLRDQIVTIRLPCAFPIT